MATYLIDYENVHQKGLDGIRKLTKDDAVIVFVGNMINNLPIETVIAMLNSPAQIKIKKMKKTTNNYLDFQLATCLGGLIAGSEDKAFFIISNDTDYEAVIDYWKCNKANVSIEWRSAISSAPSVKVVSAPPVATNSAKLNDATKKIIRGLVKDEKLSSCHYNGIYNLFLNENELKLLHNGLVHLFEKNQGKRLYDLLKNAFEQYKAAS
ncbi:MAG: hypothetical protein LBT05_07925 [Planctomycetaceae bacterium]|jgi:hypothetical protein|nr:hypothetical protein [Planctomycetaceae bacterium]